MCLERLFRKKGIHHKSRIIKLTLGVNRVFQLSPSNIDRMKIHQFITHYGRILLFENNYGHMILIHSTLFRSNCQLNYHPY